MIDVGDLRLDLDLGIDLTKMTRGGDRLRQALRSVAFSKHRLSLKIRWLDEVAIDYAQMTNTRAAQCLRLRRSQRTAADNKGARRL